MSDALKRAIRTLLQLIASGGLTALVSMFGDGLTAEQAAVVLAVWQVIVTFVQNYLEESGTIKPILK